MVEIIVLAGVAIFLVVGGKKLLELKSYKDKVARIKIGKVDISKKANGKYTGGYDVGLVSAKVNVYVKNGIIDDIELVEHNNGKGKPGEKVIDYVKEKNSLDVDTISGATNSSKVILKAIENALEK